MIVDRYTKIVLTVIALALGTIALNPWLKPDVARAQSGVVDVNIREVGGSYVSGFEGVPVYVKD